MPNRSLVWNPLLGKPNYNSHIWLNPSHPANNKLALWLLANESAGSSVRDLSGNQSTLTLTGTTWVNNPLHGPTINFGGSAHGFAPNTPALEPAVSPFTILVKLTLGAVGNDRRIIDYGTVGNGISSWLIYLNTNVYAHFYASSSGTSWDISDAKVIGELDGSKVQLIRITRTLSAITTSITDLYTRIETVGESEVLHAGDTFYSGASGMNFARYQPGDSQYWTGKIFEVLVYKRAISDGEFREYLNHPYGTIDNPRLLVGSGMLSFSPAAGTVCWGHDTGVTESNIRNFTGNWSGTGYISGVNDAERLNFVAAENEESETWNIGAHRIKIQYNKYSAGSGIPTIKYKNGATQALCEADSWHNYIGSFVCSGWVKVRIET